MFRIRSLLAAVATALCLSALVSPALAQTVETVSTGPLGQPFDVAFDSAGNLYVADTGNQRVVRIDASDGSQSDYGSGYIYPYGLAFGPDDALYVADLGPWIKRVAPGNGPVTTVGSGFNGPQGVAVDGDGNVYVADTGGSAVRRVAAADGSITTLATGLSYPSKLALSAEGDIFVAGQGESTIRRIAAGTLVVTDVGSGFGSPRGVAVDAAGNVFVSDTDNGVLVKVTPDGQQTNVLSATYHGLRPGADGKLYAADTYNNAVVRITGIVETAPEAEPVTVPTLSEWTMMLFGLGLAGAAAVVLRNRRRRA